MSGSDIANTVGSGAGGSSAATALKAAEGLGGALPAGGGFGLAGPVPAANYGGGIASSVLPGIMPGATVPSTVSDAGGIFSGAGGADVGKLLGLGAAGLGQPDTSGDQLRSAPGAAAYRGGGQQPNFMPTSAISAPIGSGPAANLLQMILQQANTPKF